MTDHVISVPEVHCDHCVNSIEGAVGVLAGVDTVKVDLDSRTVAVSFEPESVSVSDIVGAIEEQGYEVPA